MDTKIFFVLGLFMASIMFSFAKENGYEDIELRGVTNKPCDLPLHDPCCYQALKDDPNHFCHYKIDDLSDTYCVSPKAKTGKCEDDCKEVLKDHKGPYTQYEGLTCHVEVSKTENPKVIKFASCDCPKVFPGWAWKTQE